MKQSKSTSWTNLNDLPKSRLGLSEFVRVWTSLDEFGRVWASLGEFGRVWASLDKFVQICPNIDLSVVCFMKHSEKKKDLEVAKALTT